MASLGRPHPERMALSFTAWSVYFSQRPFHDAVSPKARIHGSEDQWVEMNLALLIIILHNPLVEFLLLILATLSSADLEDLVLKGGILPLGHTRMIPLNWKMGLPLGYFGLSCH